MNIKSIFFGLLSVLTVGSYAQGIETDDMYFNSKDRAKLKAAEGQGDVYASAKKATREEEQINPTDSYSARNVNPEYAARENAEVAQSDNEDYYVSDYDQANNLN